MPERCLLSIRVSIALVVVLLATEVTAEPAGKRRALLIGINDYISARARPRIAPPGRDWTNLRGSVTDVAVMKEMLVLLHGFAPSDIVTLTDQAATRAAILQTLDRHFVKPAAKGDTLFFYFAGHGSQVANSLSDEADKLDESLVPADSLAGARDIRDKELRPLFTRILERGARLTILLDSCHSGSGARGLATGARLRSVKADPRDVADRTAYGPRPEALGALVLAATEPDDAAWETRDSEGTFHGAFSWAWIRAMRDAVPGETAAETFQRAAARMRAETPYQDPSIGGTSEVRLTPFLGARSGRSEGRAVVPVEKIRPDGTIVLLGGWAHGLSVDSELRVLSNRDITTRVIVTALHGLGRSEGRIESGRALPQSIHSGALLQIVSWASPSTLSLRVWTPRVSGNVNLIRDIARRLADIAAQRGLRWVTDPGDVTPTHLLRRGPHGWELLESGGERETLGPDAGDAFAALAKLRAGASLFVQLPAPAALIDGIAIGPGTDREGIQPVETPEEADYILVGRYASRRMEYAWVRPGIRSGDRRKTGLPTRTRWTPEDGRDDTLRDSAYTLRDAVLRLRRIQGWLLLESPPQSRSAYRLALRRSRTGQWVRDDAVIGGEAYELVLRAALPLPARVASRYFYVFVIDSDGKSFLAYPQSEGSVENRFPTGAPTTEIALGEAGAIEIREPYGVDTYFLLSTDEPLRNPGVLEWDGVRAPAAPANATPLEQLLLLTGSARRGSRVVTPATWSIERVVFESVPPRTSKTSR